MLFHTKINGNHTFYLIMTKGDNFNYVVELSSLNNKILSNEELEKYKKLDFNLNNIKLVLVYTNLIDIDKVNLDNFDISTYNYITYKSKLIELNNWIDLYNLYFINSNIF